MSKPNTEPQFTSYVFTGEEVERAAEDQTAMALFMSFVGFAMEQINSRPDTKVGEAVPDEAAGHLLAAAAILMKDPVARASFLATVAARAADHDQP
jgi:hypothetical protein